MDARGFGIKFTWSSRLKMRVFVSTSVVMSVWVNTVAATAHMQVAMLTEVRGRDHSLSAGAPPQQHDENCDKKKPPPPPQAATVGAP